MNLGVDRKKMRIEVERLIESGGESVAIGKLPQTPRAKRVIEYAIEESRALKHGYVGTEHILLGLIREDEGIAAQVLMNVGLKLKDVRQGVLNLLGGTGAEDRGISIKQSDVAEGGGITMQVSGFWPWANMTPEVNEVIEYAMEESRALKHGYVGTEHILLGLIREDEGIATQALLNLGLRLKDVRQEVLKLLGG